MSKKKKVVSKITTLYDNELKKIRENHSLSFIKKAEAYTKIGREISYSLDLGLYSLTQDEKIIYVCKKLDDLNVKYNIVEGNIFSINKIGKPVFVAHLDIIDDKVAPKKDLLLTDVVISRRDGILGADDNCGINLILNHCKDINFALFVNEECGGIGATFMSNNIFFMEQFDLFEIPCMIELDRMNGNDIIGSDHGYCMPDLSREIKNILPNYKESFGVFTDIDSFTDVIACVNLSVGYYNQHTNSEFLNIEEFEYIDSKILDLNTITGKFEVPPNKYNGWAGYDQKINDNTAGLYNVTAEELSTLCQGDCDSCLFVFDCMELNGGYNKLQYSSLNSSGDWNAKHIDEDFAWFNKYY